MLEKSGRWANPSAGVDGATKGVGPVGPHNSSCTRRRAQRDKCQIRGQEHQTKRMGHSSVLCFTAAGPHKPQGTYYLCTNLGIGGAFGLATYVTFLILIKAKEAAPCLKFLRLNFNPPSTSSWFGLYFWSFYFFFVDATPLSFKFALHLISVHDKRVAQTSK